MFALVSDVGQYPEFLPWCDHATVLSSDAEGMTAEIGIAIGGVRQQFSTRNLHRPGRRIAMQLLEGPFSQLQGQWDFTPLGDAQRPACRVEFTLSYGFDNPALAALVGPVFDKIAGSLVDAFVKRAEQVHG